MTDFDKGFWVGAMLSAIAGAILFFGVIGTGSEIRAEAIGAGVAEWRIDPNTGDRSFHWINESERE